MKTWRNISALKSVKGELETLSGALASALESVITTPVDENKNTEPLRGVVQAFSRVPGTLELLGCTQLALLAQEVLQLLNDTLAAQANLDGRGLDLRLELAFAAVTDLPALLEYSLFQESDEFLFVCQHINKLRKARACAILFSGAPLLEKADVDFRTRFEKHPDKMLEILAKQAELFVRCSTALHKNPEDAKALQLSSSVLDNLELLLRDHRIGVLWGLGRAIVESYPEAVGDDKTVLASSLLSLVPLARQLIEKNAATLQDAVDEGIMEKLVNVIDKLHAAPGSRAAVVKLWYNIDMAGCREFRNQYRKLQVSYYNKGALNKCLQLIRASIVQLIDAINDQVETDATSRDGVNRIHAEISTLRNVLRVLRMHFVADMVDQALPDEPADDIDEALSRAAGVLFRMNKEVCSKLDSMEREVFSSDRGITAADSINSGQLQIMKTAKASLDSVTAELDSHVDAARGQGEGQDQPLANPQHLQLAQRTLDEVSCVLNTLPMPRLAEPLGIGRDYLGWVLRQAVLQDIDEAFQSLSYLVINSLSYLEQLIMGRDDAVGGTLDLANRHAEALKQFLAAQPEPLAELAEASTKQAAATVPRSGLFVIPTDRPGEVPDAAPEAEEVLDTVAEPDLEPEIETVAAPVDAAAEMPPQIHEEPEPEPAPTPETPASLAQNDADAEIREIFAEEFDEVLENLQADHQQLLADPALASCITDCRRHYHTLKGSGRMVGASVISGLSELMEKVYDKAGNDGGPIPAAVLGLTSRCIEALPGLKADFCSGADPDQGEAVVAPLCAAARALLAGETPDEAAAGLAPAALPETVSEAVQEEEHEPEPEPEPQPELESEPAPEMEQQDVADAPEASTTVVETELVSEHEVGFVSETERAPEPEPVEEPDQAHEPELLEGPEPVQEAEPAALPEPPAQPQPPLAATPEVSNEAEDVDEALLAIFLEEADDLLQGLDTLFLKWRQNPADNSGVPEYMRLLHTMKGSAALVCEHELSKAAHDYETFLLDTQRSHRNLDDAFFAECDRRLLAMQEIRRLYGYDADGHITRASSAAPQASVPEPVPSPAAAPQAPDTTGKANQEAEPPAPVIPAAAPAGMAQKPAAASQSSATEDDSGPAPDEQLRVSSKLLRSLLNDADEINFSRSRIENAFQDIGTLLLDMDEILNRFLAYVKTFEQAAGRPRAKVDVPSESKPAYAEEFDTLEMDRYTELHQLALSMTEDYNDLQDIRHNLSGKVKEVDAILTGQQRLTNSLQDGLISSQMVPFASVVPRFGRLVRQISGKLGKQVRFEVQDQQGSLDKNVLQAIITPLEHIIRNAIDHGIEESAEARSASGKQAVATLKIAASRQGASFVIRISDDGRGIDVKKVMQHARNKGLLPEGAVLKDEEAYRLLFKSGFSTSAAVSNISGRGVGLDVVRSEIEHIGGSVGIESAKGKGTTFVITLPLTSSLNRALLFEVQDARYVVLMNTLDGVLMEKLANILQKQQEANPVFEYGGKRYEYLYLGKLINENFKPRLDSIDNSVPLLLVTGHDRNYALHIDAIIESRDLVVKSIGQQFAAIPGIAGGVIMPDGNVAIVLELKGLVNQYGIEPDLPFDVPVSLAADDKPGKTRKLVMVVDDSITVRKVTTAMLERNGMDVVSAKNGLEAVELLENTLPDVILLDIEMPKMDGFEFATHVRAQPKPISDIPIIMITSRIGDKHRTRAEAIGVNQYLCKPFEETNLLEYIRSY